MPRIHVNGIDIYHEIKGQGPKLLFIGGTGGDLRHRPGILESPLAQSFMVLTYDQRGQGRTDKPDEPYSMAGYADDTAGLARSLDWGPCPVVGFSFGAMVGLHLALRHPELCTRLALMCGPAGGQGGAAYPLHEIWDLPVAEKAIRLLTLSDSRRDQAWQEAHPKEWQTLMADTSARLSLGEATPQAVMGAHRQLEARRGHDVWQELPNLKAPVLLMAGRYDGIASLKVMQNLAGRIAGARLEVFEGGHYFFQQDPRAFEVMIRFCLGQGEGA
jgi:3-oxoadipate enol-lactonase